ncbi:hypothetical protein [Syntrophomonas curvata]
MAKGLDLFQQSSAGFTRQISPWDTDVCHCRSLLAGVLRHAQTGRRIHLYQLRQVVLPAAGQLGRLLKNTSLCSVSMGMFMALGE